MTERNTRRGFTQIIKKVVICPPCGESGLQGRKGGIKKGHCRECGGPQGSGIFNACCCETKENSLLNGYVEDPRLQASGMTPNLMSGSRLTYKGYLGFTLIELLVVVLIIGILAAVALPQYNKAVKKSQGVEALVAADVYDKALSAYYLEHGTYEGITADTLGVSMPTLKYFKYLSNGAQTSDFQVGTARGETARLYLNSSSLDVRIDAIWRKGKFDYALCSGYLCETIFQCNWVTTSYMATLCYINF